MKTMPDAEVRLSGKHGSAGRVRSILAVFALVLASMTALVVGAGPDAGAQMPATIRYAVKDLGTLGGPTSIARDVNDAGQVVGQAQNVAGQQRAFIWEDGRMTDLDTLGGPMSAGRGINRSGQAVGFSRISPASNQQRAFVTEKVEGARPRLVDLGTLPNFASSEAWDINDPGQVVGRSYNSVRQGRAFLYDGRKDAGSRMTDIGALLGDPYSEAWGVNNSGEVVGEAGSADGQGQAFLYAGGETKDLGVLPGHPFTFSEAMAINDAGQVVGWSYSPGDNPQGRAFLYERSEGGEPRMTDLGTLGDDPFSRARDIDESGRVVGWSRNETGTTAQQFSAVLWEDGSIRDLNDLIPAGTGWKLTDAYAIDGRGRIAGSGFKDGQLQAFLLTPDTTAPRIECENPDGLWHGQDVSIPCKADDAETGLADSDDAGFSLSTSVPDGAETADARTGTREVCDAAGNCATAGPVGGNRVDKKAPDIEIDTPADGAEYKLGETLAVGYACSDDGSGVTSCTGPIPHGNNIDTASVGQKTFAVEAADEVGNVASVSHDYVVVYDFDGFFGPVDNPDVLNRVQAGSAVPAKFGLPGDQGLDIFAEDYPKSQRINCDSAAPVDNIEQTVSAGESGLTYDAAADQYSYVWKTSKAWNDTCRQLVVKLDDGTVHQANFRFK